MRNKKSLYGVASFCILVIAFGLLYIKNISMPPINEGTPKNFILFVGSQSYFIDPVDIKVYIDGELVINQDFDVGKGTIRELHNWKEFQFSLSKGTHKLYVKSIKGDAELETEFEIKEKHWAVINYWYNPETHYDPKPKHFTFGISDKPISFE